jgi:hypothetical protein
MNMRALVVIVLEHAFEPDPQPADIEIVHSPTIHRASACPHRQNADLLACHHRRSHASQDLLQSATRRLTGERARVSRWPVSPSPENADLPQYRQAVEDTLQQLEWCIGYLHGIGKTSVARAVARNRSAIRSQLNR